MGSGKLKAVIGILIIVGGIYVAWNMVPPYFHNYQFQDDLDDIARRNSYTSKTDDDIKDMVIRKADAAQIPLDDLALRRPTLDDVFLTLTGRAAEETGLLAGAEIKTEQPMVRSSR